MTGPSPGDPLTAAPEKTRLPPCRYFRFLFMKLLVHADSRTSRLAWERGELGRRNGFLDSTCRVGRCDRLGNVTDCQRI